MTSSRSTASIVFFCCVLAGCASPPAHFYTLRATAPPTDTTSTLSVLVGPVKVPDVVDRPEFVVRMSDNEVRLDEFNRWASPLSDNMARVVVENLVALLGTSHVGLYPPLVGVDADYRVAVEVQSFDCERGREAQLDALWTVTRLPHGKIVTGRTTRHESVTDASWGALAEAHSRAVASMSADIADALRALGAGGP